MKILVFTLLLFLIPYAVFGAVAVDSTSESNVNDGTSISFSFTNTAGTHLVAIISNRLTTAGCGTTDIDALSVTYNSVALSFLKGDTTDGVAAGSGTCVFGHLMELANPATGANTFALSWTGTADVSIIVRTFSGAGGTGTILESITTGSFSLSPTITSTEMAAGALALADSTPQYAMLDSNPEENAVENFTGTGANTNTGSGAVEVHGTYATFSRIFWAFPINEPIPAESATTTMLLQGDFQMSGDFMLE